VEALCPHDITVDALAHRTISDRVFALDVVPLLVVDSERRPSVHLLLIGLGRGKDSLGLVFQLVCKRAGEAGNLARLSLSGETQCSWVLRALF